MRFFAEWHYTSNPSATKGLPLLRELCECSDGSRLIFRLAELEPEWVARWLKWETSLSAHINARDLTEVLVSVIGQLSDQGIAPDSVVIVDWLVSGRKGSEALKLLNQLVKEWQGTGAPDPVTHVSKEGHKHLEAILHLPWQVCSLSDREQALWRDGIGYHVGEAVAAAVSSVLTSFGLELGFSCGFRIAELGLEPSVTTVDEQLTKLGISSTEELVDDLLPMVSLWAALRKLADYEKRSWDHKTEIIGLRAKVGSLVATNPNLWAQSLEWILARSSEIGIRVKNKSITQLAGILHKKERKPVSVEQMSR